MPQMQRRAETYWTLSSATLKPIRDQDVRVQTKLKN